jgi:hypothetical protein
MHWTDKRDLLSLWVLEIRAAMLPPKKVPQCKMRVVVTIHNSRAYDKDNAYGACKVIFDAMKILGLIFDDRPQFLEAEVKQEKCSRRGTMEYYGPHTVIEITEAA